jgi:hypothetical protein
VHGLFDCGKPASVRCDHTTTDGRIFVSNEHTTAAAGIDLRPGEHVCALYMGAAARDDLVMAFLRSALASGDKCICIVEEGEHPTIRAELGHRSDQFSAAAPAQLDLLSPWETYLRSVPFSSVDTLAFWSDSVITALGAGPFDAARVTGDATWMLSALEGTISNFMDYESELNRFVLQHPVSMLCLYDICAFGGDILDDLLKTHPTLLLGGMLLENPHALSPDEYLARR